MILLISKGALQSGSPFFGDHLGQDFSLILKLSRPSLSSKISSDLSLSAVLPISIGGINLICSQDPHFSEELLAKSDASLKTSAFIESLETQMLDKVNPIDLDFVHLGSKLYSFYFFAPYNRTQVGFG